MIWRDEGGTNTASGCGGLGFPSSTCCCLGFIRALWLFGRPWTGTPGAVQIIHHPELPGWHLAYIHIAAGHSTPSTACRGASVWQPHTIESLNSSSPLELRHHKKFNTSQFWLPWCKGLAFLGCSSSKQKVLCWAKALTHFYRASGWRYDSHLPCPDTLSWGCPHGPVTPRYLNLWPHLFERCWEEAGPGGEIGILK